MDNAIFIALITGACSVLGVIISNASSNSKIETQLDLQQKFLDEKLEILSNRVERHNQVIERVYIIEGQIKEIQHRINE